MSFLVKVSLTAQERNFQKAVELMTAEYVVSLSAIAKKALQLAIKDESVAKATVLNLLPAIRKKLKAEAEQLLQDFDAANKIWLTKYIELLKEHNQIQSIRKKKLTSEAIFVFKEEISYNLDFIVFKAKKISARLEKLDLRLKKFQRLEKLKRLTYKKLERSLYNVEDPLK